MSVILSLIIFAVVITWANRLENNIKNLKKSVAELEAEMSSKKEKK